MSALFLQNSKSLYLDQRYKTNSNEKEFFVVLTMEPMVLTLSYLKGGG